MVTPSITHGRHPYYQTPGSLAYSIGSHAQSVHRRMNSTSQILDVLPRGPGIQIRFRTFACVCVCGRVTKTDLAEAW